MNHVLGLIYMLFYLVYCYVESFVYLFIPRQRKSVVGKIVLVTGAGHGIGRELALQLSRLGARLVIWDINKRNNETVENEILESGNFAKAYTVDVTNVDDVKSAARQVRRDVGHVDILINNAGILHGGAVLQLREDDIKRLFEINTLAHFWTVREFLPAMMERNEGQIVAIASIAGRAGTAYLTDYVASKFAVAGFMESLQDEMRREGCDGIQLCTVYPFFVNTGMAKNIRSKLTPAMPTDWVVSVIVDGIRKHKRDIHIPWHDEVLFRLRWFFPTKVYLETVKTFDLGINPQYE